MSQAGKGAEKVHRAAEREHAGAPTQDDRRKSDSEAASAHPSLTDPKLRKGHPRGDDWRDKPVDAERDKDIKEGGIEGAARKQRGDA
ncbi:MAG TPA: hypothetical protein VHW66_00340 [Stellaceae bacterium]|jgi:hypothetical protein|nr:hypothetical protein [Stellaceae bacterium]